MEVAFRRKEKKQGTKGAALMPKKYAKHGRNKRKPNMRQQEFVKELAKGKSLAQAAREAGYSDKNANQPGYQGLHNCADVCRSCLKDMTLAKKF